jgi:hypothetical protein
MYSYSTSTSTSWILLDVGVRSTDDVEFFFGLQKHW